VISSLATDRAAKHSSSEPAAGMRTGCSEQGGLDIASRSCVAPRGGRKLGG
jgi:hypothetical protein